MFKDGDLHVVLNELASINIGSCAVYLFRGRCHPWYIFRWWAGPQCNDVRLWVHANECHQANESYWKLWVRANETLQIAAWLARCAYYVGQPRPSHDVVRMVAMSFTDWEWDTIFATCPSMDWIKCRFQKSKQVDVSHSQDCERHLSLIHIVFEGVAGFNIFEPGYRCCRLSSNNCMHWLLNLKLGLC